MINGTENVRVLRSSISISEISHESGSTLIQCSSLRLISSTPDILFYVFVCGNFKLEKPKIEKICGRFDFFQTMEINARMRFWWIVVMCLSTCCK